MIESRTIVRGKTEMPKRPKPQVEETQWGPQYVLPGAEQVAAHLHPTRPIEGDQFVFPGLGKKRTAAAKPGCGPKGIRGTASFDTDRE